MKAALGTCTSVRITRSTAEIYLSVRLPLESYAEAYALFRHKRVLVTLADDAMIKNKDGMKSGSYRNTLPIPSDYPEGD